MSCTSPLTVPIRKVPTWLGAGLGQQRAQDVERALHRARGDQHLGHEVVAALEARADLLERRDERVVEHRSGSMPVARARARRAPSPRARCRRACRRRAPGGSPRASCGSSLRGRGGRARAERACASLDERGRELRDARCASGGASGPEIESAAIALAVGAEDGRGERGQADLELVDGGRVAARARSSSSSVRVGTCARSSSGRGRARRRRGRPCRSAVQWYGDAAPDPVRRRRGSGGCRPGRGGRRRAASGRRG